MVKKIDFILPVNDRYSQNAVITKWIASGSKHQGISTRLITPPQDKAKPEQFIDELLRNPPACTFCVNGILPDKEGNFLSDLLQLPHVAYVVDTPTIYYTLCNSDFTIIATIDSEFQNLFAEIKGGNTIFLPGAAPAYVEPVPFIEDRTIDILMMPHLIDVEKIHEEWQSTLPKKLVAFLEDAALKVLSDKNESFTTSFLRGWNVFNQAEQEEFSKFRSLALMHELEMYIRGQEQLELLKAFDGMDVDLIIPKGTLGAWQKILKNHQANFSFHEGVDFDTIFKKIKEAKIYLSSSPHLKFGTDGVPFVALIGGSYVFSSPNNWLETRYHEENGIYFYSYRNPKEIHEKAKYLLANPEHMDQSILAGRNKVIQEDTWNSRAQQLLTTLPSFLTPLAKRSRFTPKEP